AELDERFRAGTVEDSDGELGYYFNTKLKTGWWWGRIPADGPLAEYLRARAAERPPKPAGRFRRMLGGT
ncbi:MAG: hypothetical protein QOD57_4887, partial [Actinomycetota bacterium]|nr:hypothetical protein [Actinomycetota bacterium]